MLFRMIVWITDKCTGEGLQVGSISVEWEEGKWLGCTVKDGFKMVRDNSSDGRMGR